MTDHTLGTEPSMESRRGLRIFTIFLLYVGQGIPIGLFDFAVPGWMAVNGASAAEIGFVVAMIGIPWSFKFLNGFFMDRYTLLSMGRRRSWIIGAQLMIVVSLLAFALLNPEPRDYVLLGVVALVVNSAVTFQDVAVDGLTIDILPEAERSFGGAMMSGGQVLGIAASATITGTLIYTYGASAAYIGCAFLVGLVTAHVLWVRERTGERRLPWTPGNPHPRNLSLQAASWPEILKHTFRAMAMRQSLLWLPIPFARGMIYGTLIVAVPLIANQYAGWNEGNLGSVNGTANLVAGIVALTIGAVLTMKLGAQRALLIFTILFLGLILSMLWVLPQWDNPQILTGFVIGWLVLYTLLGVAIMVVSMRLCIPQVAATQFSIYMAVNNMGISCAGLLIATFAVLGTPDAMLKMLLGVQAFIIALALVARYPRSQVGEEHPPEAEDEILATAKS